MYSEDHTLAKIPRHCLLFVENCDYQEGNIFLWGLKPDMSESEACQVTWFLVLLLVNCGRKWAV